jgi:hypothetical protein
MDLVFYQMLLWDKLLNKYFFTAFKHKMVLIFSQEKYNIKDTLFQVD